MRLQKVFILHSFFMFGWFVIYLFSFSSFIIAQLIYHVVVISAVPQSDLVIGINISILSKILSPHRLARNVG